MATSASSDSVSVIGLCVTLLLVACISGCSDSIASQIKALKDKDEDMRHSAAETLVRVGTPAVPPLIETLKSGDEDARSWAKYALARISDAAVPHLIEALKGPPPMPWSESEKRLYPYLVEGLKDRDAMMRMGAAMALAEIGADANAAVAHLIEALKNENRNVRESAADALRKIATALQDRKDTTAIPDSEKALAALRAGYFEEHETVHGAVEALKAIEKAR